MEGEQYLVRWNVEGQNPIYSWEPATETSPNPVTRCYKFTHRHEAVQTDSTYFVLEDKSKRPEVFDPFEGYSFRDTKKQRSVEEAIPVKILGYDHQKSVFTVLFSDVTEAQQVPANTLMRIAPRLTADYLVKCRQEGRSASTV